MNKKITLPVLFLVSSAILYLPSAQYGLVTDFLNWLSKYEAGSWRDVADCFGYPGLHQFFHFFNYLFFSLAGTSPWAWYLLFSLIHGMNAFLVYTLGYRLMLDFNVVKSPAMPALICAFLFLIFPYNSEAVLWKACLHYLMVTALLTGSLLLLIRYCTNGHYRYIAAIHGCFLAALFTLELSFSLPLMSMVMGVAYLKAAPYKQVSWRHLAFGIWLPQWLMLAGYLLSSNWLVGDYIGHYGSETHIVFSPLLIVGNTLKYLFKNLFFLHYFPFGIKSQVYEWLGSPAAVVITACTLVTTLIFIWRKKIHHAKPGMGMLLVVILFLLALAPVITLYFNYILYFENDRYGYFASVFFILGAGMLAARIWRHLLVKVIVVLYAGAAIGLFALMMSISHNAAKMYHGLIADLSKLRLEDKVYVLALPDNYRGFYLFRDYDPGAKFLHQSLHFLSETDIDGSLIDIAQYNAMHLTDRFHVEKTATGDTRVSFAQDGNWFYRNGVGLESYNGASFSVHKNPWDYVLKPDPDTVGFSMIYPDGNSWKIWAID